MQTPADGGVHQPVPRGVQLDVVDPVPVAVVGPQHRRVRVGQPGVLAGLRRADEPGQRLERRQRVSRALAGDRLDEHGIARERVESRQRRRLVPVAAGLRHGGERIGAGRGRGSESCRGGRVRLRSSSIRMQGVRMARVAAVDCGTNSIRLLVADVTRRGDARRPPRDAGRAARAGRRRDGRAGPRGDRAGPCRARRLHSDHAPQGRAAGADGRHVRHPRCRQPRRLLRDGPRHPRRRGRGDLRRRGGAAVVRRRGGRAGPRRRPVRRGGRRRRVDRGRRRRPDRRRSGRARGPLGGRRLRAPDRALPARRPADGRADREGPRGDGRDPRRRLRRRPASRGCGPGWASPAPSPRSPRWP